MKPADPDAIADFLRDRLNELTTPSGGCEGQGAYYYCAEISKVLPGLLDSIRTVLDMHTLGGYCSPASQYGPDRDPYCTSCGSGEPYEYPSEWPCPTLLALASPWSAHPRYNPAWSLT